MDTSVAIPLLVQSHKAHQRVAQWWNGRALALAGHALTETYSVLTRLPGDVRLSPHDAATLLSARFGEPLLLGADQSSRIPDLLSKFGIAGGAVYDAIIALAATEHDAGLATRDLRARATYEAVGARVIVVA